MVGGVAGAEPQSCELEGEGEGEMNGLELQIS